MIAMIPNDFDVKLIFQDDDASLFAARRPDVWHFVLATAKNSANNYQSIDINQFHFPRYGIARALGSTIDSSVPSLIIRMGIQADGDNITVSLLEKQYRLPEKLVTDMQKDLPLLKSALKMVQPTSEGFEVTGAQTSRGYPVVAVQQSLAEAIAFERESRKTLDPRNFAVYSAFCTWRDFIHNDPTKKKSIAAGMAAEMTTWDPEMIGDDTYWESVFAIQEQLWKTRIWGLGIESNEDALFDAFFRVFDRLSTIQFTQFVLMNGMHQGGPFHALATLFGLIDFDNYKNWRTRELQPDSPEEQEIRTQSTFIEMLGILDARSQS